MKSKYLIILLLLLSFMTFIGCKKNSNPQVEPKSYSLNYATTLGGEVFGGVSQYVPEGMDGESVYVAADSLYEFVSWSDGVTDNPRIDRSVKGNIDVYAIFERVVYEYPLIIINTENSQKITSKENYIGCEISVVSTENPEYEVDSVACKIRGRGNSTWGMPKKPYKLKFEDKINFLNMGKGKEFTLIANYCDKSLLRNYLAFKIGLGMDEAIYTTDVRIVEVVLNNEYLGLYLVCEQNEVKENRVDIATDSDDSYFLELDSRAQEDGLKKGVEYFVLDDKMYVIKYPKTDKFTENDCKKVYDFFSNAYEIIKGNDYNKVKEVIDVDSFASTYIIYEIFNNVDVGFSSWYIYANDGKIGCGPIWDFDISCGNVNYNDEAKKYTNLYAKSRNPWYRNLLKHEEFKLLVKEKLEKYHEMIVNTIIDEIDNCYNYEKYYQKNFEKWDIMGKYVWPNPNEIVTIKTWQGQVDYLKTWLFNSLNFVCKQYGEVK